MQVIQSINKLREHIDSQRLNGINVALVPTMGNIHEGHLALVDKAKSLGEHIVVTIFVNPTQFVADDDFDDYPRTLDEDLASLESVNVDTVFVPETSELYDDNGITAEVTVPELDSIYCGKFRSGHFKGVATVVLKLLNIVRPDSAVFGEKDYQQLLIIRSLVRSLNVPVEIVGVPTVREADGLAMSSRNNYLTEDERERAPALFQCLSHMAEAIRQGESDYIKLEKKGLDHLSTTGFRPDYLKICDAETLKEPGNRALVIICAAWLGKARLIDNVAVHTYD